MFVSFLNKLAAARAAAEVLGQKPSVISLLQKAKEESDRKNYPAKHHILQTLLEKHPEQFYQDSEQGDIVGITHRSGFRLHMPRRLLPTNVEKRQ